MRVLMIILVLIIVMAVPVAAMDFTAPAAPEQAQKYLPDETANFGDGLRFVIKSALETVQPSITEALGVCISLVAAALLVGLLSEISGNVKMTVELVGTVTVGVLLFRPTNSLIRLGIEIIQQISQYGKLLLPVMTGAMAAQGSVAKSGAIYAATAFFDALLSHAASELLVPLVYILISVSIACNLFQQPLLKDMRKFIKWLLTWSLKTILYVFTGYISITGVVGGATDATMLKATKLTISGMVPVVGSILSDASEAVLVSAGLMKNAVGIYGLLVVIALWIGPFLQIGIQYLMLKATAGICEMFGTKQIAELMKDFSSAMGLVLAMTGTVCLIFIISTICFLKGVS